MSKWVRHISGQGQKWSVHNEDECHSEAAWCVRAKVNPGYHYLPKSEYVECEGPEEWEDVTDECEVESAANGGFWVVHHGENIVRQAQEYRIRKIELDPWKNYAFRIERRKS
jgi:hypothetical protein